MIRDISIKNFKSIADLKLQLGRFNVFIGENGSGKSNVLEAIALGGAASAHKLDSEFLTSRGIRVTEPELMRAAFSAKNIRNSVELNFTISYKDKPIDTLVGRFTMKVTERKISFTLQNNNEPYSSWYDVEVEKIKKIQPEIIKYLITGKTRNAKIRSLVKNDTEFQKLFSSFRPVRKLSAHVPKDFRKIIESKEANTFFEELSRRDKLDSKISGFIIFSPENTFLRRFEDEEKIQPLGIKGEGLFKLLKVFSRNGQSELKLIKNYLKAIDWFEDLQLPRGRFQGEKILDIKDRYIDKKISFIHQQSANEGFLFLLFYLSLFVSKDTPDFFAIDNVEAAFNPKLCTRITKVFNELAAKRKKQVILTTHNPFILDGLNLKDDEQRLFVIRRNAEGHTIATRIEHKESKYKLSEAWMLGYLGGLPKNF